MATLIACGPGFVDSGDVTATGAQNTSSTTGGTTGSGGAGCGADAYSNYAQNFFSTNCVSCHTNEATYTGVMADANNIQAYIGNGSMPQGATLSSSDKSRILAWFACGAPQSPTSTASTTGSTTSGGSGSCTSDTYSNYAQAFFSANCNSCHAASASSPTSPYLTTYANVDNNATSISSQISQGLMPPAPSTISASDKTRITSWISCGLPQ